MRLKDIIKTNILLGGGLLLIGATSCVTDTFDDEDLSDRRVLPKGNYLVAFNFEQLEPSQSRAGEENNFFDDDQASHFEHEIGSEGNYVIFLDSSDNVVEVSELHGDHEEPDDYIEGRYVARFDVDDEYEAPASCFVVLNAGEWNGTFRDCIGKSKKELFSKVWSSTNPFNIGRDGQGRFTMTTPIYYDGSVQIDALPLPDEVVQDARLPLDPKKVIMARVERMVAKFSLTEDAPGRSEKDNFNDPRADIGEEGKIYYPKDEDSDLILFTNFDSEGAPQYVLRKWCVKATGWGMNAMEKSSNLFKNIKDEEYYKGWNEQDPAHFRSYWAIDRNYDDPTIYPWQYRKAINAPLMKNYEGNESKNSNPLKNYSYNDFVNSTKNNGSGFGQIIYTPENTYDYDKMSVRKDVSDYLGSIAPSEVAGWVEALDQRTDVLAGTHLIFTAQLMTDLKDTKTYNIEKDLYRDRSSMFYDSEVKCFDKLVTTFNYDLQSQFAMRYHYYYWDGNPDDYYGWEIDENNRDQWKKVYKGKTNAGTQLVIMPEGMYSLYYTATNGEMYELSFNELEAPNGDPGRVGNIIKNDKYQYFIKAEVEDGDGKVILNPERLSIRSTDDPSQEAKFYVYSYQDYKDYVANPKLPLNWIREATVNDLKSLIYEWTGAVDHFNEGRMYYFKPAGLFEIGKDPKTNQPIYFCGTVRNNWYKFVLSAINGIGTSVDDPNQPIVPQLVPVNSQIELNVKVIDWHNVNGYPQSSIQ